MDTDNEPRKRSPRAPGRPLKDALARALMVLDKEGRHAVPVDVAAQDMGYKDAQNGKSKRALATLRQFGLLITPKEGYCAISRQVETYKFAPDDATKRAMLLEFFRAPSVYKMLCAKFPDRLPSDAALKYEMIQMGFVPAGVDDDVRIFRESAAFSGAYTENGTALEGITAEPDVDEEPRTSAEVEPALNTTSFASASVVSSGISDRIPVRLAGGRKAVLEIPVPFYEADKKMIKAQVDLILTDDTRSELNPEASTSG